MPISSLIIKTQKQEIQKVADELRRLKGTIVSDVLDENIVVVTETEDRKEDKSLWDQMEKISGVMQVDLIYHNFEDAEENQEAKIQEAEIK